MTKRGQPKTVKSAVKISPALLERRILILAPTGNDSTITANFLTKANLATHICRDVAQLCAEIGQGCGPILLAEEALGQSSNSILVQALASQPSWSDIPIILITSGGEVTQTRLRRLATFGPGGNVTLLERPFRPATLISAVQVALRSRQRQYEARQLMKSLNDARSRMEVTLGVADVGTWTWDVQNDRVVADKNLARLFSVTEADAAGGSIKKYLTAIHSEDRARVEAVIKSALENASASHKR
jgi:PAS domain-containing protein